MNLFKTPGEDFVIYLKRQLSVEKKKPSTKVVGLEATSRVVASGSEFRQPKPEPEGLNLLAIVLVVLLQVGCQKKR